MPKIVKAEDLRRGLQEELARMKLKKNAEGIPIPPKLRPGDKKNFETLKLAAVRDDLALVSAVRKSDGKAVALICAMNREDGHSCVIPVAVMIEGDPFELFYDPTAVK